jgi:hypothetical protein
MLLNTLGAVIAPAAFANDMFRPMLTLGVVGLIGGFLIGRSRPMLRWRQFLTISVVGLSAFLILHVALPYVGIVAPILYEEPLYPVHVYIRAVLWGTMLFGVSCIVANRLRAVRAES